MYDLKYATEIKKARVYGLYRAETRGSRTPVKIPFQYAWLSGKVAFLPDF